MSSWERAFTRSDSSLTEYRSQPLLTWCLQLCLTLRESQGIPLELFRIMMTHCLGSGSALTPGYLYVVFQDFGVYFRLCRVRRALYGRNPETLAIVVELPPTVAIRSLFHWNHCVYWWVQWWKPNFKVVFKVIIVHIFKPFLPTWATIMHQSLVHV